LFPKGLGLLKPWHTVFRLLRDRGRAAAAPGAAVVLVVDAARIAGGGEAILTELRHANPPASRAESAETYIVARGFRRAR
jgi:hypothetical protein